MSRGSQPSHLVAHSERWWLCAETPVLMRWAGGVAITSGADAACLPPEALDPYIRSRCLALTVLYLDLTVIHA